MALSPSPTPEGSPNALLAKNLESLRTALGKKICVDIKVAGDTSCQRVLIEEITNEDGTFFIHFKQFLPNGTFSETKHPPLEAIDEVIVNAQFSAEQTVPPFIDGQEVLIQWKPERAVEFIHSVTDVTRRAIALVGLPIITWDMDEIIPSAEALKSGLAAKEDRNFVIRTVNYSPLQHLLPVLHYCASHHMRADLIKNSGGGPTLGAEICSINEGDPEDIVIHYKTLTSDSPQSISLKELKQVRVGRRMSFV